MSPAQPVRSGARGFDTVLVANRGEIAMRVMRTAKRLGHRTVAVYSDADVDAPHVRAADEAVHIGAAPAAESYLRIDHMLEAARVTDAGAIHPGYGFLSENAAFAEACAQAGLVFVGPGADAIRRMGDKAEAKRLMAEVGVPLLDGYQGEDQSIEHLLAEVERLGTPLMIKASAGGGGKGMRLLLDAAHARDEIEAARREARSAFGNDDLILERALIAPRHVEIQILADEHGNVRSLGERDCSIQRRHQKVIEEAPSPAVGPELRERMGEAAVRAARAVNYVGAGTVEFLLSQGGEFHFLEMNTRLQVEHAVTELVTGLDLVEWQLRIAGGEVLDLPGQMPTVGHAIEVRLYAEDATAGFLPCTGDILDWQMPLGIRVDAGVTTGSVVSPHYDPMLAKFISHGSDRSEARRRMLAALGEATILGVRTNRSFLIDALREPVFAEGRATTSFIADSGLGPAHELSTTEIAAAAAVLHAKREAQAARRSPGLSGWSNAPWHRVTMMLELDGISHEVRLRGSARDCTLHVGETEHRVKLASGALTVDDRRIDHRAVQADADHAWMRIGARDLEVRDMSLAGPDDADACGEGIVLAPMHGRVAAVHVQVGDAVTRGDRVLVLEAMKMEHSIEADIDGVIEEIATAGAQAALGDVLVRIAPREPE